MVPERILGLEKTRWEPGGGTEYDGWWAGGEHGGTGGEKVIGMAVWWSLSYQGPN